MEWPFLLSFTLEMISQTKELRSHLSKVRGVGLSNVFFSVVRYLSSTVP